MENILAKRNEELHKENVILKARIAELEQENESLQQKSDWIKQHSTWVTALEGESLILQAIGAEATKRSASYDGEIENLRLKVEIKKSRYNPNQRNKSNPTDRWAWNKIIGQGGGKNYKIIFLVGMANGKFKEKYKDPSSPYVIFEIPYGDLREVCTNLESKRNGAWQIKMGNNPDTVTAEASKKLFEKYQITVSELELKYKIIEIKKNAA